MAQFGRVPMAQLKHVLDGYKVLDFTQVLAGPTANRPGYDTVGAAYAGVLDMCGYPDRAPVFPALGIGDVSTGVHALAAITSALLGRERSGRGQYVETSLLDCYFGYHELNVQ